MVDMPVHPTENPVIPDGSERSAATDDATRRKDFKRLMSYVVIVWLFVIAASITASRTMPDAEGVFVSLLSVASAWAYAAGVAVLCFWAHYKACQVTYRYFLVDDVGKLPNRVLYAMLCMAVAHLGQMTGWGIALAVAAGPLEMGELSGETTGALVDYLHFAFASYTSLGLGDVTPEGYLKLITAVTTLTGLLCIGWTASLFVGRMGTLMQDQHEAES